MPPHRLRPTGRAKALARALLARAWPCRARSVQPPASPSLPALRRDLPDEEGALIDALSLRIGPAFRGAMARSAPRPLKK